MWIKSRFYDRVDYVLKRMLEDVIVERQQREIINVIIGYYKKQAEDYERTGKRSHALKIYERLVNLVQESEMFDLKIKILSLYEKLGRVKEYLQLKRQLEH